MGIIKKTIIQTKRYNIREISFLGFPLYQYIKIKRWNNILKTNKTYKFYSLKGFARPKNNQRIFYLKVHRVHRTSLDCIRHWVNIAGEMNAFIYFVCDNKKMKKNIRRNITFANKNFAFIKSDRKTIKKEILKILHNVERLKLWKRIAFSMMTPFIHAAKNNLALSYNIDADDILLCLEPSKVAQAFLQAEQYAKENNIDLLNIDMFYSKSFGTHWSFGVVICTNPSKCLETVKQNTNWRENRSLIEKYNICYIDKFNFNIDWLFTYLRDTKLLNMRTFYIENALVAHMPDIILEHGWGFMIQWMNGFINFPILTNLYNRKVWDFVPIPKDCIRIDVAVGENDYKSFLNKFYDFGVGFFEMDMLLYAKERELISDEVFDNYAHTKEFVREVGWRKALEE